MNNTPTATSQDWALLALLSILWGASFIFIGIAVKQVPPPVLVMARVVLAAAVLIPIHLYWQGRLPRDLKTWIALAGMSVLNNVIPFSLIMYGQQHITAGLAAVINATSPLFGAAIMALAGAEALTGRRVAGLLLGLSGVIILRGLSLTSLDAAGIGVLAVLAASASYGASALWAKRMMTGIPAVTSAQCQLIASSVMMSLIAFTFSTPEVLLSIGWHTWAAIAGLAILSTALAYLIFFRILNSAGPSMVLLVTMLIPVSAIVMGAVFLNETILVQEVIGALVIASGLLVIDGRVLRWFKAAQ